MGGVYKQMNTLTDRRRHLQKDGRTYKQTEKRTNRRTKLQTNKLTELTNRRAMDTPDPPSDDSLLILFIDLFTLYLQVLEFGQLPWRTKPPAELIRSLEMGERLPKPKTCTLEVYALMLRCKFESSFFILCSLFVH